MSQFMRPKKRALSLVASTSMLAISPLSALSQSESAEVYELAPIVVQGEAGASDSTVPTEDLQARYSGNPQNALDMTPGVSTRQSSGQPGIEVNIRGMSGYGRVNSMIDGVPQSFKNTAGHEASGGNLLYIQPEFLSAIDIERGVVSGAAGAGTLTGAANFRTISLDDILREGETEGGMARLKFGDNGYNYSGLLSYGKRFDGLWGGDGHVDVLLGYAYTDEGDYATGDDGELSSSRTSVNAPEGKLAKIEIAPNDTHKLSFGARWYGNTFDNSSYTWDVDNQTWTADYAYTPGNDLIDLKISTFYNNTTLYYPGTGGSYAGRETEEETYGLSVTNNSRFALANGRDLTLDYGLSWTRDDFQTHAMRGGNNPGKLDKASLFVDWQIDYGRVVVFGGLRYDHWQVDGYRAPYAAGVADCPPNGPSCGDEWVKRDGGEILPNIGLSYAATQELTLSASYAHTFRPPTTHEMFYGLVPFGDGVGTGMTNNLDLDPETSRTVELSAEFNRQGVWGAEDQAWFKATVFRSWIKDYIVNDFVSIPGDPYDRAMWVNTDGTTIMQGIEFEGGYDTGKFYANLSFSISDTDSQPVGNGTGMGNGLTSSQPDRTAMLDVGMRAFEETLTLGAQVRYVGATAQAAYDWGSYPDGAYLSETDSYTLVDLYGSYALNETAELFVSIENVFDESYGYPGGNEAAYQEMAGRGRTFIAGLTTRF